MEKIKGPLLVPVAFFLIFIVTGAIKLCVAVAHHDVVHIIMESTGITLSIAGITLIVTGIMKRHKRVV